MLFGCRLAMLCLHLVAVLGVVVFLNEFFFLIIWTQPEVTPLQSAAESEGYKGQGKS